MSSSRGSPRRAISSQEVNSVTRAFPRPSLESIMEQTRSVDSPLKESGTSWDNEKPPVDESETCPHGCCENESLGDFILKRGFFEGACSDIVIKAFNQEYNLHKLILDRSGYFNSLFSGPWNNPAHTAHELIFDDDENITQEAFELAIARLYGAVKPKTEIQHTLSLIAVGQYLDIPEVVCSATDTIIDALSFGNIAKFATFAAANNYGKASERIIDSAKGLLCSDGWQNGYEKWDGIPTSIIAYVVGHDAFFVPSEWERAIFIMKLIERRQMLDRPSSSSLSEYEDEDLDVLFHSLNTKVHYCHLSAEQLHKLEGFIDSSGKPLIDPPVLRNALWLSISLHKKVATAGRKSNELGLVMTSETAPDRETTWFIPTKDETLYGTPQQLEDNIGKHHHIRDDMPSGKTTENAGESLYKVSEIPPFRFSIAFSQVSELEAEKRVYAKTLWYAGSYWNLYIQKIRHKKGYQMGVYIHRASNSAPSKSALLNRDVFKNSSYNLDSDQSFSQLADDVNNLSIRGDIDSSISGNSSSFSKSEFQAAPDDDDDDLEDDDGEGSFLSYEDNRVKTSVYYVIYTPSRKGKTSLTCFISTPDLFNKSQSWGWKSNSMCAFNDDGTLADGQDKLLKFMVVLGNT